MCSHAFPSTTRPGTRMDARQREGLLPEAAESRGIRNQLFFMSNNFQLTTYKLLLQPLSPQSPIPLYKFKFAHSNSLSQPRLSTGTLHTSTSTSTHEHEPTDSHPRHTSPFIILPSCRVLYESHRLDLLTIVDLEGDDGRWA